MTNEDVQTMCLCGLWVWGMLIHYRLYSIELLLKKK